MTEPAEVGLIEASIMRVWNERDDERRLMSIEEIYHAAATIYEPNRAVTGHRQISTVVAEVLAETPPGFRFEVTGPTLGHHGLAVTRWQGGPPGEVTISGADAVRVADGKIFEHYFFFDPKL
ncbi:nuclear transport factor 2 family protein [Sphingomonas nostoxanthinifaciens]|uniref:nuclear transport factor 2 family protein n=1 Tax=Sphingomonas nostoxanthinifaciens TaxID=2872652 RepID=UPI001CC1C981|nr:nuclear transport factor 2 family protein [Sphingomonas nostoxanthinifaciens]UAK25519.1 nuclear transport factor 2 family protein [Sphingomonas nostoxanthinifaciens]